MTKEELEAKRELIIQQVEQLKANLNAHLGALELVNTLITEVEQKEQ